MIGVFGASGFIGKNLIDFLNEQDVSVRAFARSEISSPGCEVVNMDFSNPDSYRHKIEDLDSVVLLVSASNPGTFVDNIEGEISHNLLPYSRFLKEISKTKIRRVVFLSSGGAVYGVPENDSGSGISESHKTTPISPYGLVKLYIEQLFRFHAIKADWSYTILRPSNPVGVGQSAAKGQGLIAKAIEVCLNEETMQIWGDGSAIRDYFGVRHLCSAIFTVLKSEDKAVYNETFNVSGGNPLSVNEVLGLIEDVVGKNVQREYVRTRSVDVPNVNIDSSYLEKLTGWKADSDLRQVIKDMVENLTKANLRT